MMEKTNVDVLLCTPGDSGFTQTGLCLKAQGCEERATLGLSVKHSVNPNSEMRHKRSKRRVLLVLNTRSHGMYGGKMGTEKV